LTSKLRELNIASPAVERDAMDTIKALVVGAIFGAVYAAIAWQML